MEDMNGYHKVAELLMADSQALETHMAAIKRAMCCIGSVHRKTWLANKTDQEAKLLLARFRWLDESCMHYISP